MKTQKNKIVFALVLVCVVLFITIYGIMIFGKDKKAELDPERIPIPDLEETQVEYDSKLKALEAMKEEREVTAPPIYPDHMIDDKGYFNPDYMEYEKQRIIDSVFDAGALQTGIKPIINPELHPPAPKAGVTDTLTRIVETNLQNPIKELGLSHQLFFASNPKEHDIVEGLPNNITVKVYVDGDQTLRDGQRLDLRLSDSVYLAGNWVPKGTRLYGFVKIRPNRVMVDLPAFGENGIPWKAYDLQDDQEGIYVENHLKGELMEKGLDEAIGEMNVPGLPQIGGLNRIFQRHNRAIKVEVKGNYQLMLKPKL
ncbi:conjugative transposon protein TraM [Flagellimonas amoyensis]|uniref:conjugative transposon protein TraM n=1 Tax=Flagellimonas amoyensis TaxID=2169401 RepID=UPI000D38BB3D|nr:conjugative transposon protein TraM [Allomuricauda amoyensis]